MSDDDRTTPLGLFNYARSYWQSGVLLHQARAKVSHPFKKLVDEASTRGLSLRKEEIDIAAVLTEKESIRRSRYIETGCYQRPGLPLCLGLAKASTNLFQPR